MYSVYFAKSRKNGKVYVGYTEKDPKERVIEHNQGSNKWSSQNGPFTLIYYEGFLCKDDARLREKFYKSGIGKRIKK
jgi:putative endonuclease